MRIKLFGDKKMEFNNPMSSRRFSKEPFKEVSKKRDFLESKTVEQADTLDSALKKIAELEAEIARLQKLLEDNSSSSNQKDDKTDSIKDERFDEVNGGNNV